MLGRIAPQRRTTSDSILREDGYRGGDSRGCTFCNLPDGTSILYVTASRREVVGSVQGIDNRDNGVFTGVLAEFCQKHGMSLFHPACQWLVIVE